MYHHDELGCYYVRVPKTGSTSFLKSWELAGRPWRSVGSPHLSASEFNLDGPAIGFVRNPVDWAISAWNHARRQSQQSVLGAPYGSFREYVENIRLTPAEWLDHPLVKVFRLEEMNPLLEEHGLECVRMNVSHQEGPELTDDVLGAIRDRFALDYDRFYGELKC